MNGNAKKKRALIMAGGGLKVGFQAGVLQVWLDEAGLVFDHADGASGGCFNLAMYAQGMSGKQIADNWRNLNPFLPVDLSWRDYLKLPYARGLFSYDNFRKKVLPFWGIDWDKINRSEKLSTFNIFNFSKKRMEVITQDRMNEDWLIASVSLPMWFPPVIIDGQTMLDSVYITDANVEEAIRRGADELWAIWTVSTKDEWNDGFVAQYFQIIETTADTHFFGIWERIAENNRRIRAGKEGEFGRVIEQKLIQAEVPINYLFNFSKDRMAETVNLGVKMARQWCREQNIPLTTGEEAPTDIHSVDTRLQFSEEMKGFVTVGQTDWEQGFRDGKRAGNALSFEITLDIEGVNRFVTWPDHQASASGFVVNESLGGHLEIQEGRFNLLVDEGDPTAKKFLYRLFFVDQDGAKYTLAGHKDVRDDPGFDVWTDTTTLFTTVYRGFVQAGDESAAEVYAAGILKIHLPDFLHSLTTFKLAAPSLHDRIAALNRFGNLFMGKLWDVYARRFLEYGAL